MCDNMLQMWRRISRGEEVCKEEVGYIDAHASKNRQ